MHAFRSSIICRYAISAVLGLLCLVPLAGAAFVPDQPQPAFVRLVRTLDTSALGLARPAGLAFIAQTGHFLCLPTDDLTQPLPEALPLVRFTPWEEPAGRVLLPTAIGDQLNMAYNNAASQLLLLDTTTNQLLQLQVRPSGALDPTTLRFFDVRQFGLQRAQGMTLDPVRGRLFILDSAARRIVRVDPDAEGSFDGAAARREGRIAALELKSLRLEDMRGLALDPGTGHLWLVNPAQQRLVELTEAGQVVATRDLAPFALANPQGLVFAPSGDRTDDPAVLSLYLADRGGSSGSAASERQADRQAADLSAAEQAGGQIVELALTEPASVALDAPTEPGSLAQTIQTSRWSPSSPDPSGITYLPATNRLLISDGEVDEMALYQGANLFEATLAGSLHSTANTLAFSDEPVGVGIHPGNGHRFITDDDQRRVFEVDPGPDDRIGSADDSRTWFSTSAFNCTDPEGVAYGQGQLYIVDGVNAEVYIVNPGANGRFDGVAPTGDDRVTHWDTAALGLRDPEGIDFNPDRGTLFLVTNTASSDVVETTTTGRIVRVIETSYLQAIAPAGIAYAPSSAEPGQKSLYLADRGIDNDTDAAENDGKIYEIVLGSVAPLPATPTPTRTPLPTLIPTPNHVVYVPLVSAQAPEQGSR